MQPHDYQQASIDHLSNIFARGGIAAVDASDAGTGKTLVAVEVAKRLNRPTLIVSPRAVMPGWERCAAAQQTELSVLNYEMLRTGRTPYGRLGKLTSRQKRNRFIWAKEIGMLVFDEAHRCVGDRTVQSEMMKAARRQRIPTLALSATLADSPLDMDALGYLLGMHDNDESMPTLANPDPVSFQSWVRRHNCGKGAFQELVFKGSSDEKLAIMAQLNAQIFPRQGVRVRIADLGDRFPDSQISAELYRLGNDETEQINAIWANMADALARLAEAAEEYVDPSNPLSIALLDWQRLELLKVPLFVELAEDGIKHGLSVAIFVNFRATLNEVMLRLESSCKIDGSQIGASGAALRERNRLDFVEDRSRVIGVTSRAGGEGLDLPDIRGEFPRLALISPNFSAKQTKQLLGRVRRANSKTKSIQRIVLVEGTPDEHIYRACAGKWATQDALLNSHLMPIRV